MGHEKKRKVLASEDTSFAQFIEALSEGILVYDNDTIVEVNTALLSMSGDSREDVIGQSILAWVTAKRCREVWQALHAGDTRDYAMPLYRRDGSSCSTIIRGKTIFHYGHLRHALIVCDVSAQKNLEEALHQAKAAAAETTRTKNEFIATMSHELRTPLNIVIGYTDLLLDDTFGELSPEQKNAVGHVRRSTVTLIDFVTSLLSLRSLTLGNLSLQPSVVLLVDVLNEVAEELAKYTQPPGVAYIQEIAEGLPSLCTDPEKLKDILRHVMGNAFKFTPEGHVRVSARPQGGGVLIQIADTGIGIPPESLATIFSPFVQGDSSDTRQYGGAGLGLHLVKQLLSSLAGTITVESTVGQGSTFSLWFPLNLSG